MVPEVSVLPIIARTIDDSHIGSGLMVDKD